MTTNGTDPRKPNPYEMSKGRFAMLTLLIVAMLGIVVWWTVQGVTDAFLRGAGSVLFLIWVLFAFAALLKAEIR